MRLLVTAEHPGGYASALRTLFDAIDGLELADDVRFGPLDMTRLMSEGLTVSGSVEALVEKMRTLEGVRVQTW